MIFKYGLVKAILFAAASGVILGVILGVNKTEMPVFGNAIFGAIIAPISIIIYAWGNKK